MSEVFVDVNGYPDYQISNHGRLYSKKTNKYLSSTSSKQRITLYNGSNRRKVCIHQLVMEHFGPPPPDYNYDIDHKDRNTNNNHIDNLRYVTHSTNCQNKTNYNNVACEYVDTLPDNKIAVTTLKDYELKDIYYCDGNFYVDTGAQYRKLHVNKAPSSESYYVCAYDTNHKKRKVVISTFKREYQIE